MRAIEKGTNGEFFRYALRAQRFAFSHVFISAVFTSHVFFSNCFYLSANPEKSMINEMTRTIAKQ